MSDGGAHKKVAPGRINLTGVLERKIEQLKKTKPRLFHRIEAGYTY